MTIKDFFVKFNASNKLRDEYIMFNYKFDDETKNNAIETFENAKIDVSKLLENIKELKDNYILFLKLKESPQKLEKFKPNTDEFDVGKCFDKKYLIDFINKIYKLNTYDAFDENYLESLNKEKNEYIKLINEILFLKQTLCKLKDSAIKDYKIPAAVKLDSKIKMLTEKIMQIVNSLTGIQNQIVDKENEYVVAFNEFVDDVKKFKSADAKKVNKFIDEKNLKFINNYSYKCINSLFNNLLKNYKKEEVLSAMDSLDVVGILGRDYQKLREEVINYGVGADSKLSN